MALYEPDTITCKGLSFRLLLSRDEILERIEELGCEISRDFEGKNPIFVGVLNGAFIFLSDLIRHIEGPCEVDFLKLSSYGDERVSSGNVTDLKDINANITGRHVVLVEDIVDTGLSMNYLLDKIQTRQPASVSTVTLLHKPDAINQDVQLDYVGFEIPPHFVLGYGLDYAQEGRNLAQIYIQDES